MTKAAVTCTGPEHPDRSAHCSHFNWPFVGYTIMTPAAPVTSTSSARSKKTKKEKRKNTKRPETPPATPSSSDTEDGLIAHEESPDPTLAYVPPVGSVPADFDTEVDFGEFDYDAVKADEGAELWLVRAPAAVRLVPLTPQRILLLRKKKQVKAKNLHGVRVSSSFSVAGRVGELSRKTTAYDIWSLAPPSSRPSGSIGDSQQLHVCAEELNGISVLLPRKRKGGKLFLGACGILYLPPYLYFCVYPFCSHAHHSTETCHATPRCHRAPSRAHSTQAWRGGLRSRYLPKPSARSIPRRGADASLPTLRRPWGPSAGASRRPDRLGCGR